MSKFRVVNSQNISSKDASEFNEDVLIVDSTGEGIFIGNETPSANKVAIGVNGMQVINGTLKANKFDGPSTDLISDITSVDREISGIPSLTNNGEEILNESASIKCIYGNSMVWNQYANVINFTAIAKHGVTVSYDNGKLLCSGTYTGGEDKNFYIGNYTANTINIPQHRYLCQIFGNKNMGGTIYGYGGSATFDDAAIITSQQEGQLQLVPRIKQETPIGTIFDETIFFIISDLTRMFGAGNEPATVEEFYQRLPKGVDLNAYNEGEIIDGNYGAIKTMGFNQWDEQWEVGTINGGTGANSDSNTDIRSSNYIPVHPSTPYFFKCTSMITVVVYNANKEYIGYMLWGTKANLIKTTPSNASYIRIATYGGNYGAIYNNDICINISDDSKNGTYEPYVESNLDLSWIKKYFSNGMRRAGSIYDEITFNETTHKWEATQRVGVVDLGSLTWTYTGTSGQERFTSYEVQNAIAKPSSVTEIGNVLTGKYATTYFNAMWNNDYDKTICVHTGGSIAIKDLAYTDVTSFKAAIQGMVLNYELAEPIVTEITELNVFYNAYNGGTELLLSNTPTTPLIADIAYQYDAVARLNYVQNLSNNISSISNEDIDNICSKIFK